MNIKTKPFIITTAAAAVFLILLTAANTLLAFAMLPNNFSDFFENPNNPQFQFIQITTLISCLATLLTGAVYIGSGVLYAFLHNREDRVAAESGALGGAASAALGSIASALASGFLSIFITPLIMNRLMQGVPGLPPGSTPFDQIMPFIGLSTIFGMVGTLVGACFGAVIAAVLGALGGAVTAALLTSRRTV